MPRTKNTPKKSRKQSVKKNGSPTKKVRTTDPNRSRVFVGNVPYEKTAENIKEFIGDCGTPASIKWVNYPNGSFRGYGFIDFDTKGEANRFVEEKNQEELLGRKILVKHAEMRVGADAVGLQPPINVFIGNVTDPKDDELKTFVGKKFEKVTWVTQNDEFRGYGFVQFATIAGADNFVKKNGTDFQGKSVRISYATGYSPTAYVKVEDQTLTVAALEKFVDNENSAIRLMKNGEFAFVDFGTLKELNKFMAKKGKDLCSGEAIIRLSKGKQPSQVACCYIAGFPEGTTEKKLRKFAGANVMKIQMARDDKTYAFVHFVNPSDAKRFVEKDGQEIGGKTVQINLKIARKQRKQSTKQEGQGSL
jgi:RNA recognition motif-containing protein